MQHLTLFRTIEIPFPSYRIEIIFDPTAQQYVSAMICGHREYVHRHVQLSDLIMYLYPESPTDEQIGAILQLREHPQMGVVTNHSLLLMEAARWNARLSS